MIAFLKAFVSIERKKLLLISAGVVAVIVLDAIFLLGWQFKIVTKVSSSVSKIKSDIKTFNKDLEAQEKLKSLTAQEITKIEKNPRGIIREEQFPSLLKEISEIANKNKVRITQIKPLVEKASKVSQATGKKSKGKKPAPEVASASVALELDVLAEFHRFGAFLNDLENARSIMAIESLKMMPDSSNAQRQKIKLVLRAYVKK